jgi:hypothetical protein
LNALWLGNVRLTTWSRLLNKFWVLVITRDPPACAQCISVDFEIWSGVPLTGSFWLLTNVPVLFVCFLVSDKFYSKFKLLLVLWVDSPKIISSVMFEAGGRLVKEDYSFNVGGKVVCGLAVYTSGIIRLKVEGDRSS